MVSQSQSINQSPHQRHSVGVGRISGVAVIFLAAVAMSSTLGYAVERRSPPSPATVQAAIVWDDATNPAGTSRQTDSFTDQPLEYGPAAVNLKIGDQVYRGVHRMWHWNPGSHNWTPISPDLTQAFKQHMDGYGIDGITAVAKSGTSWYVGTLVGRVAMKHGDMTWQETSMGLPARPVSALSICPTSPGQRMAAVGYGGYSSVTPAEPGHLYVTLDGGQHWQNLSGDLPDAPVQQIQFIAVDGRMTLYVKVNSTWYRMGGTAGEWVPSTVR